MVIKLFWKHFFLKSKGRKWNCKLGHIKGKMFLCHVQFILFSNLNFKFVYCIIFIDKNNNCIKLSRITPMFAAVKQCLNCSKNGSYPRKYSVNWILSQYCNNKFIINILNFWHSLVDTQWLLPGDFLFCQIAMFIWFIQSGSIKNKIIFISL